MQEEQAAKRNDAVTALLSRSSYTLYELKKESWRQVTATAAEPEQVIFVDGGQAKLVATPTAELHRIRTAVTTASGKGISYVAQKQGRLLVKLKVDGVKGNGGLVCEARFSDSSLEIGEDLLMFESAELGNNANGTALAKAAESARRLAELHAAIKALESADINGRFLVLDGTLETFSEKEKAAMAGLMRKAKERKVALGAVAKTCSVLTNNGESLIAAAEEASCGREGYILVAEGKNERHNAAIAVARLNKSARHLFKIEAALASELDRLIAALKAQSNDLAFPGYPYGFIMADRFARVSNAEAGLERAKAIATAKGELKEMLQREKALNAHTILDGM